MHTYNHSSFLLMPLTIAYILLYLFFYVSLWTFNWFDAKYFYFAAHVENPRIMVHGKEDF